MLTSIFSRLVITFGDYALPTRTLVEEVVLGLVLVIPFSILVGHVTMRIAILPIPMKLVRADVWNTLVRLFRGRCAHGSVASQYSMSATRSMEPGYSWIRLAQSWGFQCQTTPPLPYSDSNGYIVWNTTLLCLLWSLYWRILLSHCTDGRNCVWQIHCGTCYW